MASDEVQAGQRVLARAAATAAERFGDRVAMRHREDGEWRERSFRRSASSWTSSHSGSSRSDSSRATGPASWRTRVRNGRFASLAISRAGGVVVPIYPTNSPEECEWVAGNSEARIAICEDDAQADKIAQVRDRLGAPRATSILMSSLQERLRARARRRSRRARAPLRRGVRGTTRTPSSTRRARLGLPRASC